MAAVDYFLKIDGIAGESTDRQHKGEIEVESFRWGVTQVLATGGAGGATGRPVFSDFVFVARQNASSPSLMLKCATGQHIKQAVLTARTQDQRGQPQAFLTLTLSDILVTAFNESGASDVPDDSTALHYASIQEVTGAPQQVGIAPTAAASLQYDPKTNTVQVVENTTGVFIVGTTNGGISRAVEEFDITSVLGLITRPQATAKLRLLVDEVRMSAATLSSAPDTSAGRGHAARYDVVLYTPADLVATADDLIRSGRRVGRLWVDPSADPATLDTDISHIFQRGSLTSFGVRVQLHDARITQLHEPPDDPEDEAATSHASSEGNDKGARTDASAAFRVRLVVDTA